MAKRALWVCLVLILGHCALSPCSQAQNSTGCVIVNAWAFGEGAWPFGWFYFGQGAGNFSYLIGANEASCSPRPECPFCPQAGKPISLATGDTYIQDTDVSLPGLGGGLTFSREWNSIWPVIEATRSVGIFGANWRSTYEESVFLNLQDKFVKYSRGDGSFWSFGLKANDPSTFIVASPANITATMKQIDPATVQITFQNGETRLFATPTRQVLDTTTTALLQSISDRNGNTTGLSYDQYNRLHVVQSPANQHLYFNYGTGTLSQVVTSVTSDFGITFSYSYDTNQRLIQVTKPDLTTISYTYNAQSQITSVTDSNGKVLESHTYDSSGRGLTSSRANGVESLTVSY